MNFQNKISAYKIPLFLVFTIFFLFGCTPKTDQPEREANLTNIKELPYCNIDSSKLCLEGFGTEGDNHLIILLKTSNEEERKIFLQVNKVHPFECYSPQESPENLYCVGNMIQNGEEISIDAYKNKDNSILASGNFQVQYGAIKMPESDQLAEEKDVESPSNDAPTTNYPNGNPNSQPNYPNDTNSDPNYPNYPNYPNTAP